jgi:4-diphosphocytidyl-2-C-methyl-D-erythritol kinase
MGAGLGGGSSDAVYTLLLLNKKFELKLTPGQLSAYAGKLGSDCTFFIKNSPCFATGRGEILEDIQLDLSAYRVALIHPGIHINTRQAFSEIMPSKPKRAIKETIQKPVNTWKETLFNDFEIPVFAQYPEIRQIKDALYEHGAIYAAMSGSGSSVFGLFDRKFDIQLPFKADYIGDC